MKPVIQYRSSLPEELKRDDVVAVRDAQAAPDALSVDLDAGDELPSTDLPLLLFFSERTRSLLSQLHKNGPVELFNRSDSNGRHALKQAIDRLSYEKRIKEMEKTIATIRIEHEALLNSIDDLVIVLSREGAILWFHRPSNFPDILDSAVVGRDIRSLPLPAEFIKAVDTALVEICAAGHYRSFQAVFETGQKKRTFELKASSREDGTGACAGITISGREITELVETRLSLSRMTEELEESFLRAFELAFTDQITGLPNREALLQTLEMTMENRNDERLALMLLHVRNLSNIRNSTRFDTGNQILKTMVERLKNETDRETFLARYGDDEFGLFMPGDMAEAEAARLIRAIEAPVKTDSMDFTLSCTAGLAVFPDDATEMEALVQSAEIALREAREHGVEKVRLFSPEDRQRLNYRMHVETELLRPNITDEMSLVYQPIVDASTRKIRYLEVLLRWTSPVLGDVPPDLFIPLAEKNGVIISLTNWMITESTKVLPLLPADIRFSVNLSPVHLLVPTLVDDIAGLIEEHHMDPDRYKIEITEGVFIRDPVEATQRIHGLKSRGFTIALDDFGVGFSGLSYLGLLPVDSIKIDRSFLQGYPDDRRSTALIESILTLTRSFGIDSIAEGVEREEQIEHLNRLGCSMLQGFLLSRPLKEQAMLALFS